MSKKIWLSLLLILSLGACSLWEDPRQARVRLAASGQGEIRVGAVWPWDGHKGSLWLGMALAEEELNAAGGVLGRPFHLVKENDEASLAKGRQIAQQFTEDPQMVAVIGHLNSYIALPAAAMYEAAGMVFITPGASDYQINLQGFQRVFRSSPSNRLLGQRMAEYMAAKGYHRVAIAYVKDKTSQGMSNYFEQRARELGLTLVDRRAYIEGAEDFSQLANTWKDLYAFDALFIAGNMPVAGRLITELRRVGLNVPVVGGDGMDTPTLFGIGAAAEGVVVPDFYHPDPDWAPARRFEENFRKRYQRAGDTFAAQGYDAVMLLADAMVRAGSSDPERVAAALHATRDWPGATGLVTFDDKGDIPDKRVGQKIVRAAHFESLP